MYICEPDAWACRTTSSPAGALSLSGTSGREAPCPLACVAIPIKTAIGSNLVITGSSLARRRGNAADRMNRRDTGPPWRAEDWWKDEHSRVVLHPSPQPRLRQAPVLREACGQGETEVSPPCSEAERWVRQPQKLSSPFQ